MIELIKSLLIFIGLSTALVFGTVAFLSKTQANKNAQQSLHASNYASCKQVIMYSTTRCGACKIKKQVLSQANIPFIVHETDINKKQNKILWQKAREAGWGRFGVPVLEVNGKLFRSNVTVSELKQNLC